MSTSVQAPNKVQRPAKLQLRAAYAICRGIARGAAKNFYYGFLALPRRKRNALSAIYAFMRHCDDLADDPAVPTAERAEKLAAWHDALHRVVQNERTDDPVLMAVADTQRRYEIPMRLLDELVEGTAMDIRSDVSREHPLTFDTFDDLYRYCYHVASVVGLVTIRIFGYQDPKAEELAEHLGVAFQLTNILRDVKEDAEMGRVYLPSDQLALCGLTSADVLASTDVERLRPVMQQLETYASRFYEDGQKLLLLIDEDARPALWALIEIYHRLLLKIVSRNFDVFSDRVRVPTREKIAVLARGMIRRIL